LVPCFWMASSTTRMFQSMNFSCSSRNSFRGVVLFRGQGEVGMNGDALTDSQQDLFRLTDPLLTVALGVSVEADFESPDAFGAIVLQAVGQRWRDTHL
jgi:hypothetical protein